MCQKIGNAPFTFNSDGLLSLLRISKLDPDLHGAYVLPCKTFDIGNE